MKTMRTIKSTHKSPMVSLAVILTLAFTLLAPIASAHAVEVPNNTTEVRVPLVLAAQGGALAGGEIEFSYSAGLTYVGYQPAVGLTNPVGTQIDGKTYAGFFATDNRFEPTGGRLSFGSLVFTYAGTETENITISEIDLHRLTASGEVDSQRTTTNTVIPVTRATSSGGAGNGDSSGENGSDNGGNGDGANGNNTNPIYPGNPAGTGTPGATVVPIAAQTRTGSTETEAVEISAETGDAASAPRTSLNSNGSTAGKNTTNIAEGATPLAQAGSALTQENALGLPLGVWIALAVALITALTFVFFFVRRRRSDSLATETAGYVAKH